MHRWYVTKKQQETEKTTHFLREVEVAQWKRFYAQMILSFRFHEIFGKFMHVIILVMIFLQYILFF